MKEISVFSNDLLQDHQLCFIHIPKTAGTSFTDVLYSIVGREKLLQIFPEVLAGYQKPDYDINDFACLAGHFPFEIYKLINKTPLFLTFLREPIARSVSSFQQYRRVNVDAPFIKQLPGYAAYQQLDSMTLEDFIHHPLFTDAINNLQTRMLGLSIHSKVRSLTDLHLKISNDRNFSLELAKERIEQFMFVGIQEEFQMSLEIATYQFGLFPLRDIPKLNISQEKMQTTNLPDAMLNQLHELNSLDIELYDFGLKLFRERYSQMITKITPADGTKKRPMVELLAKAHWERKDQSQGLRYQPDLSYPKQGWYPIEVVENEQWMWSGPENISSIDLPVNRSINLRVHFQVRHALNHTDIENLELRVDGQNIKLTHTVENWIHHFTGIIPADAHTTYAPSHFSFYINETIYPQGLTADSPGARLLGFALSWMEIEAM